MQYSTYHSSFDTLLTRYARDTAAAQLALGGYDRFFEAYKTAWDNFAKGHKDLGLRFIYALQNDLSQVATHDREIIQLKNRVEATIALWGAGFDWD